MTILAEMPSLQLFPSLRCNLRCPYCTQPHYDLPNGGSILTPEFCKRMQTLRHIHLYVSGGEPLLAGEEMEYIIAEALRNGHRISVDTNLAMPTRILEEIFLPEREHIWGFVNISHHLFSGVEDALLENNVRFLQKRGIPLFVKYIATPDRIDAIRDWLAHWQEQNIGATATIIYGPWGDRVFPGEYTREEIMRILPLMGLISHALQFLGGINLCGLPCRGGNDFLSWNQVGTGKTIPCCHGRDFGIEWDETWFSGKGQTENPCRVNAPCSGDNMFIYGFQGVFNEVERFEKLCRGTFAPVTLPELFSVAKAIMTATGREFGGWDRFIAIMNMEE